MLMRPKMSSGVGLEKKERKGFNYRRQKISVLLLLAAFLADALYIIMVFFLFYPLGRAEIKLMYHPPISHIKSNPFILTSIPQMCGAWG